MNSGERLPLHTIAKEEHKVEMKQRKDIHISGVKALDSFDSEEFLLETTMGYLVIRGQQLQLKNLNLDDSFVQIMGNVYEMTYVDDQREGRAKGLFGKLFK